jgi:hypothetical protein
MEYFHTKNPKLGIFGRALKWKMLVYVMDIRCMYVSTLYLQSFDILGVLWYILPVLVCCTNKDLATLVKREGTMR